MKTVKDLLAFCFCLLYANIATSQWSNVKSPNAYPYINFVDLKSNIFLSGNDDIYYSKDLGESWLTNTNSLKGNLDLGYFPNPTKGELNIEVLNGKSQSYTLRVTDLLGKEILKEVYIGSSYKMMSKHSMSPGIYFIKLEGEDGKRGYRRFVVE